jgi:hypothetical protein
VPRPRQTTMAGAMVMLAATFVVISVADTVSRLRSIETRDSIEAFLADAPGSDLGLSVESMIQVLHGVAIVAALCSVAAVALGWQVLQRSRQARVALSVLALPIFVTGLVAGGFMSSLVAVATAMLWLSPSREWFAGQPIPEPVKPGQTRREADVQALSGRAAPPLTPWPTDAPVSTDAAVSSVAAPVGRSVTAAERPKRPDPVTVALVVTVVIAGMVFLMTLVSLVVLSSQPDLVLEELRRQNPDLEDSGITESLLLTTSYVSGALAMAWSALAIVLAVLVAGRRAWAAKGLLLCAAACALFCLVATLASAVALIPAVAAIATVSCLRRPEVRRWLEAPR